MSSPRRDSPTPFSAPSPARLQNTLDTITANTRNLVQPERLAVTERAVAELFDTGIEDRVLPPGVAAPPFALPGASATMLMPGAALSGKLVRSSDLLALGPVVLTFFRGRWDPYCVTELEAWQALYPEVRARGALLVAISPQLPRQNDFLVQQHGLTFPILSDAGCQLAGAFGIAYTVPEPLRGHYRSMMLNIPFVNGDETWQLPLPATFVLTPERASDGAVSGVIRYSEAHADHRVRPDPADVLALLT